MTLARVIWACDCHATLEEDAPALYVAAPDMLAALRAINDAYSLISNTAPAPLVSAIRKARRAMVKAGLRQALPPGVQP